MKEIPLTQGKVALIDDEDFELIYPYSWVACKTDKKWYARARVPNSLNTGKTGKLISMHRFLMKAGKGEEVDHKDGNGLNNTRDNIRKSTSSQNKWNSKDRGSNSGFKGVYFDKPRKRYQAYITKFRKRTLLGRYLNAKDAALAYDRAAVREFGQFSKLNLPNQFTSWINNQSKWEYPTSFTAWGVEESEAFKRTIKNDWFTYGKEVESFENEIAEFHNRKYAVMVNSGSSANLLAVFTLLNLENRPIKKGDKVAVPAIAWATSYSPLIQAGLDLIVQDVGTSWIPDSLTSRINECNILLTCPILGVPCNYSSYKNQLGEKPIYWIDDACESLGATYKNNPVGSYGLMSTLSLFMSHQISAIEGGVVLTDDFECYRLCKILRSHGWTRDVDEPETFEDEYNFTYFGYNIRPLELHAAIAREQLKKLQDFVDRRCENLLHFNSLIQNLPIKMQRMQGKPSPFGIAFTCETKEDRARLVTALRSNGIDCRLPTGGSFTKHPYGARWRDQKTPNADRIHDAGLFLGLAPFPIPHLIEKAVKVIKDTL